MTFSSNKKLKPKINESNKDLSRLIDDKVMNNIDKKLNEAINNKVQDKNINNDKIEDMVSKIIDMKSKINKSNKDLTKLINDKVMNNINKNLNDIIDKKLEGININDMIDDNVKKVKKKERKIDEKLKEDVKYVFDNFMQGQKLLIMV